MAASAALAQVQSCPSCPAAAAAAKSDNSASLNSVKEPSAATTRVATFILRRPLKAFHFHQFN